MEKTRLSKFIALILRHKPEEIGITLNEHGWASVPLLISGINKSGYEIDMSILEEIVEEDEKQRYSFNSDKTKIRANQGHSVNVDVELKECEPPEQLFHGTGEKFAAAIRKEGLIPKTRLYVHLSKDKETAEGEDVPRGLQVLYLRKRSMAYKIRSSRIFGRTLKKGNCYGKKYCCNQGRRHRPRNCHRGDEGS